MSKPYLLCIGHRGAMGHAPENTLTSVKKALELGAPCLEVDVYHVDGELVVFHDERLERTTDGVGYLCEQSFDYLRSLDAGDGQQIPTLTEVCDVVGSVANLNIELKGIGTAEPVAALLAELIEHGWRKERFLISSFHHEELLIMKHLQPEILLGGLVRDTPVEHFRFSRELGAFSVHLSLAVVNQHFVDEAHKSRMKVFVFAVDEPEGIADMYRLGVDGVFTGFPERVLEHYSQGDNVDGWSVLADTQLALK